MNSLSRLLAAIILGMGMSTSLPLTASDSHGHIIYRDHDGNCIQDDDEDDDCSSDIDDEDAHAWEHDHNDHDGFFTEDDNYEDELTNELDDDTAWPSRRENFSEQFK